LHRKISLKRCLHSRLLQADRTLGLPSSLLLALSSRCFCETFRRGGIVSRWSGRPPSLRFQEMPCDGFSHSMAQAMLSGNACTRSHPQKAYALRSHKYHRLRRSCLRLDSSSSYLSRGSRSATSIARRWRLIRGTRPAATRGLSRPEETSVINRATASRTAIHLIVVVPPRSRSALTSIPSQAFPRPSGEACGIGRHPTLGRRHGH
jgi:hypothetical protein